MSKAHETDTVVEGSMTLRCADADEAERLMAALAPDNEGFVDVVRDGATLTITAKPASPGSTLRTLDDVIRCVQAFHGIEERRQR